MISDLEIRDVLRAMEVLGDQFEGGLVHVTTVRDYVGYMGRGEVQKALWILSKTRKYGRPLEYHEGSFYRLKR